MSSSRHISKSSLGVLNFNMLLASATGSQIFQDRLLVLARLFHPPSWKPIVLVA
jgi:hypothetical protein